MDVVWRTHNNRILDVRSLQDRHRIGDRSRSVPATQCRCQGGRRLPLFTGFRLDPDGGEIHQFAAKRSDDNELRTIAHHSILHPDTGDIVCLFKVVSDDHDRLRCRYLVQLCGHPPATQSGLQRTRDCPHHRATGSIDRRTQLRRNLPGEPCLLKRYVPTYHHTGLRARGLQYLGRSSDRLREDRWNLDVPTLRQVG